MAAAGQILRFSLLISLLVGKLDARDKFDSDCVRHHQLSNPLIVLLKILGGAVGGAPWARRIVSISPKERNADRAFALRHGRGGVPAWQGRKSIGASLKSA